MACWRSGMTTSYLTRRSRKKRETRGMRSGRTRTSTATSFPDQRETSVRHSRFNREENVFSSSLTLRWLIVEKMIFTSSFLKMRDKLHVVRVRDDPPELGAFVGDFFLGYFDGLDDYGVDGLLAIDDRQSEDVFFLSPTNLATRDIERKEIRQENNKQDKSYGEARLPGQNSDASCPWPTEQTHVDKLTFLLLDRLPFIIHLVPLSFTSS